MNYNFNDVFDRLKHLVGWESSRDSNLPNGYEPNPNPPDNWFDNPISGQYYNNVHPLVTLFNVYNSIYSSPNSLSEADFTTALLDKNKIALQSVLSKLASRKKIARETKTLLEKGDIYRGLASPNSLEANTNRFVGWRIELGGGDDYVLNIHSLTFQFSNAFVGLPVYLFHSSKKEAIATLSVDYNSSFNTERVQLPSEWELRKDNENYGNSGYYFIGYFQSDLIALGAQAYNRTTYNFSLHNVCHSCGDRWSYNRFLSYTKHFQICAISIESEYLDGINLPDLGNGMQNVRVENHKTFGLNANVSIVSDITNFLIKYSNLLVSPLQYEMAWQFVNSIAYNVRANSISSDTQEMARLIVLDKDNYILKELENNLEAFDVDLSGQNSASMPNKTPNITFESL